MYLDIERQHMKTTKLKMRPGKAAKKVSICKDPTVKWQLRQERGGKYT